MYSILVTGAGGLVGYEVARYLQCDSRYHVISMIHSKSVEGLKDTVHKDLLTESINDLTGVDVVVHCAAVIPGKNQTDAGAASANQAMDEKIIRYCRENKCKLVYFSSIAVYGQQRNEGVLTEDSCFAPEGEYARQKIESEKKIAKSDFPHLILRIPSPYGVRQKTRTVLKIFIENAQSGKPLTYYGSGNRTQNFVHVKDIARAVEACIPYNKNAVFNIAGERAYSMKELAVLVASQVKELNGMEVSVSGVGTDPQENVRTNISVEKAERELGWKPEIALEAGIEGWLMSYDNSGLF